MCLDPWSPAALELMELLGCGMCPEDRGHKHEPLKATLVSEPGPECPAPCVTKICTWLASSSCFYGHHAFPTTGRLISLKLGARMNFSTLNPFLTEVKKKNRPQAGLPREDLKDLGQAMTLIDSAVQGHLGSVDFTGFLRIHRSLKPQQASFRVSLLVGLSVHSQGPWPTPAEVFYPNSHSVLAGIL